MKDRSIIVTGSGSGIGRATAIVLSRLGCKLMIADVNDASGKETVSLIEKEGGTARFVHADVSIEADVQNMVDLTVKAFGRLDGAFNNAGMMPLSEPIERIPLEGWQKSTDINLKAVFLCMKYEYQAMLQTGRGAIVNNSSAAGMIAYDHMAEYTAAKHGVLGLTKAAAIDGGKHNIRVNAVLPGGVLTPMARAAFDQTPGLEQERAAATCLGRFADPSEVGELVAWLLSDAASYVTGACIPVDGGQTARGS